ncbi:BrnA antitoxin family protein [Methylocucumis oryzae]|nr:BrnA antitoxin family protein [Methylocucumis oryzae]
MNGSKMTTMTTEQMRKSREQGESKTNWALLRQNVLDGIEPEEDEDSPDATLLLQEEVSKRRSGRPAGSGNKEQVAIRFDKDILASFRSEGAGWQTRMNEALREWLATHHHIE